MWVSKLEVTKSKKGGGFAILKKTPRRVYVYSFEKTNLLCLLPKNMT